MEGEGEVLHPLREVQRLRLREVVEAEHHRRLQVEVVVAHLQKAMAGAVVHLMMELVEEADHRMELEVAVDLLRPGMLAEPVVIWEKELEMDYLSDLYV